MGEENTEAKVKAIVSKLSSEDVAVDSNLVENGYVDSLGIIELVAAVEQKFEVQVPYSDVTMKNFGSIKEISSYLEKVKNERRS